MKIDFNQELKALDGTALPGPEGKNKTTLKDISCHGLLAAFDDERNLSGEEKCKRYVLATWIYANDDLDLTVEDIALIKKLIGKGFTAIVVGQAFEMLEGKK